MQVWYCVTAKFTDASVRDEYLAWLGGGHMAAVVQGGALSARAVVLEGPELRVATQYFFADSEAFERYVREFAPALRADGAARFPAQRGVIFERLLGDVALSELAGDAGRHSPNKHH